MGFSRQEYWSGVPLPSKTQHSQTKKRQYCPQWAPRAPQSRPLYWLFPREIVLSVVLVTTAKQWIMIAFFQPPEGTLYFPLGTIKWQDNLKILLCKLHPTSESLQKGMLVSAWGCCALEVSEAFSGFRVDFMNIWQIVKPRQRVKFKCRTCHLTF